MEWQRWGPTSGKTGSGEAVYLSIIGDNFGVGEDIMVYFGDKSLGITVSKLTVAHTLLNVSLPEGEGTNLSITIIVSNQTGTTNMYYLTYAAPIISEIITADESIGYPPSGCKFFEELINKDPKSIGLACSVRASVFVRGKRKPGKRPLLKEKVALFRRPCVPRLDGLFPPRLGEPAHL